MQNLISLIVLLLAGITTQAQHFYNQRSVFINDQRIPEATLNQYQRTYGSAIPDGQYWYDATSGLWGQAGGPALGIVQAKVAIGGQLRRDASNGRSGSFINGRELQASEAQLMQAIFGAHYRNRYWMDAQGNMGLEGGPALINVYQLAQQYQNANGSHYNRSYSTDTYIGGDNSGFYIMGKDWSYSKF